LGLERRIRAWFFSCRLLHLDRDGGDGEIRGGFAGGRARRGGGGRGGAGGGGADGGLVFGVADYRGPGRLQKSTTPRSAGTNPDYRHAGRPREEVSSLRTGGRRIATFGEPVEQFNALSADRGVVGERLTGWRAPDRRPLRSATSPTREGCNIGLRGVARSGPAVARITRATGGDPPQPRSNLANGSFPRPSAGHVPPGGPGRIIARHGKTGRPSEGAKVARLVGRQADRRRLDQGWPKPVGRKVGRQIEARTEQHARNLRTGSAGGLGGAGRAQKKKKQSFGVEPRLLKKGDGVGPDDW